METTTASYFIMNTTDVTTGNHSSNSDNKFALNPLHIMSLIVYCLAFILGVLGNGVVIWVTGFKMKKTVNTVWFLNLAVADFLFTAFLPMNVTYIASSFHWPFGKLICKCHAFVFSLNMFASVYILMVVSVDRCVSVVWPVWSKNHRNVRKASCVSLGAWVLALILSVPYFIFRDTARTKSKTDTINCFNNFSLSNAEIPTVTKLGEFRQQVMTITRFILAFVVPYTVIVSCYAVIIHRIRSNPSLASRSSRTFKIIAAVITMFFLCWAPFYIMSLIDMVQYTTIYRSERLSSILTIVSPITTSLAFLNSCLNPLLYVFMGQDFKDKLRKSILNILQTAFQDEETHSGTKSVDITQSNERSALNTEV